MMTPLRPVNTMAPADALMRTAPAHRPQVAKPDVLLQPQFGLTTLSFGNGVAKTQGTTFKTPPMTPHHPVGQKLDYYA